MKRFLAVSAVILAIASFGSAQAKFSLQIGGGTGSSSGGDLARGLRGQSDFLADEYGVAGAFEIPRWSVQLSGEGLYEIHPRLSVGLGIGSFRVMKESSVSYTYGFVSVTETIKPEYRVIPVTANVHYFLPLGRSLRLDFSGGFGYYLARLDYDFSQDLDLLGYRGQEVYTFRGSKGGPGLQGGLGLEFAISPKLALVLDVRGRYASISGIMGDWTETGGGDFWQFEDAGTGHTFWFYDWSYNGKTYSQILFQDEIPSGGAVSMARSAKLDLSGFSALLSLKIALF